MLRYVWPMLALFMGNAHADTVVKACGHHDYAPWNWVQDGRIVGICAEVTERLMADLGYEVDLNYVAPWARCQADVQAGAVDINICAFKNPERESYSYFTSIPMGINTTSVFVSKGREFDFRSLEDLKGKTIGLVRGVSMGPEFDSFIEAHTKVERSAKDELNFKMLSHGRIDAVPTGLSSGLAQIGVLGLENEIVALPKPITEGKLYISVSKKSRLAGLAPKLDALLASDKYKNISEYLASKYINKYVEFRRRSR